MCLVEEIHEVEELYSGMHFSAIGPSVQFSSVTQSCPTLRPHQLQHTRLPSPAPRVYSNSCPLSWWYHPKISSSVIPFSTCLQSFPASGSFLMSQFFASGGQNIGVSASASVLPINIQDWFPLGLTALISLQSKGFLRVFSNTTIQKHQSFGDSTCFLLSLSAKVLMFLNCGVGEDSWESLKLQGDPTSPS